MASPQQEVPSLGQVMASPVTAELAGRQASDVPSLPPPGFAPRVRLVTRVPKQPQIPWESKTIDWSDERGPDVKNFRILQTVKKKVELDFWGIANHP